MYMFLNIIQKENVFRKIEKLNCDTLLGNATFDLIKLEGSNQMKITEAPKVERKLNTIKVIVAIMKKIK